MNVYLENQEIHHGKEITTTTIYLENNAYCIEENFKDCCSGIAIFNEEDKCDKVLTEVYLIKGKWYVATRWSVAYMYGKLDQFYKNLEIEKEMIVNNDLYYGSNREL